ncbi:MAG: DUF1338 family protein [Deltaproteobacteria bacterium]|nr:DUF1338 family protein [Deltaproteobacteria bacterium]
MLHDLLAAALGAHRAARLTRSLHVPAPLTAPADACSRGVVAFALCALLMEDLLRRVPEGHAYTEHRLLHGHRTVFDHGALRTVDGPSTGALPRGYLAVERVLVPLGYAVDDTYPLPRLHMTGRAFQHRDLPADIPQLFVSELHLARLSAEVQAVAARVFGASVDPLSDAAAALLARLQSDGALPLAEAARLLPALVGVFDRHHALPSLADYQALLAESSELAWISTEGSAFNHVTDRVDDVQALAASLRGRLPMKDTVEVSASGRVLQTATRATEVLRPLFGADGDVVLHRVPGSFYELITRLPAPSGGVDLRFDANNATGIFKMTEA